MSAFFICEINQVSSFWVTITKILRNQKEILLVIKPKRGLPFFCNSITAGFEKILGKDLTNYRIKRSDYVILHDCGT